MFDNVLSRRNNILPILKRTRNCISKVMTMISGSRMGSWFVILGKWTLCVGEEGVGVCLWSSPLPPQGPPSSPQVLTAWQQLDLSIAVRGLSQSKWKFMKNWWCLQIILFLSFSYCFLAFLFSTPYLSLSNVIWVEQQMGLYRGIYSLNGLKVRGQEARSEGIRKS